MGVKWTEVNKYFRSALINPETFECLSMGFRKFVNLGETPKFEPWNNNWKFEARHKIDGSCLLISRYKKEWVIRTRGTSNARNLANGHEIDLLIDKYPNFFSSDNADFTEAVGITWLTEWTTPSNVIVIRESHEPELILIGAVANSDGSYYSQNYLDVVAKEFELKRPAQYNYNSIQECIEDVTAWEGKEGVVIYSPNGQTIKKIKASLYCELHKMATGMNSLKDVLNVFMESPKFAKYSEFYNYVETTLDYEIAEKCKDEILKICAAYSKVLEKIKNIKSVVEQNRNGLTRKEQSLAFQERWRDWRLSAAFKVLDSGEIPDNLLRKGIESELGYEQI